MNKLLEEIKECKKCSLHMTRNLPTIYCGNTKSKIVFIGEAPGKNEDETGVPFCGRAGNILDELLESINLKREEVYITNIIKCRPPKNRDPEEGEIKKCKEYLDKQLEMIKPKVICPLGRFSSKYILNKYLSESYEIGEVHGKVFKINDLIIIPMYHPAAAIYDNKKLDILKKDIKKIINSLK
ncbi:MAG: uracil-DNA glycosylase [Candidatus Pacebacteria bacterium]|nr:uracil-DNA glycosylase [Candidatus Paceibacterota bacterium]